MFQNSFFQKNFIKKRYIFNIQNDQNEKKCNNKFLIEVITMEYLQKYRAFLTSSIPLNKVEKRILHPDFQGFIALEKYSLEPVGYFWTLSSQEKSYWHDQFLIKKREGFLFNGFVSENFRGQGIFQLLIKEATAFLIEEKKCTNVFDVVESLNHSSIRSHEKVGGKMYYENFLLKILGINIFSIFVHSNSKKCKIYYVLNKRKLMQN